MKWNIFLFIFLNIFIFSCSTTKEYLKQDIEINSIEKQKNEKFSKDEACKNPNIKEEIRKVLCN